jgi:hypothetical protein
MGEPTLQKGDDQKAALTLLSLYARSMARWQGNQFTRGSLRLLGWEINDRERKSRSASPDKVCLCRYSGTAEGTIGMGAPCRNSPSLRSRGICASWSRT